MEEQQKKRRIPIWGKILIALVIVLGLGGVGVYAAVDYYYNQMNIETDETEVEQSEEYFDTDENTNNLSEVDPDSIQLDSAVQAKESEEVINILICGEEAINDDRGRTDSIMIATINQKDNQLSLTSIMRDTYVSIPGFSDNKINAAYHNGGMKTLVATIKENFGISVDGYVLVNFDSFQEIIDAIGGIDIELSQEEVTYLNSTNYISESANRNLTVGVNHMNGNQALGYARVRYVGKDGVVGDFARTLRHRTVMKAIYKRMMDKSTLELVAMIPDILPLLTTNMKKSEIINCLTAGVAVRNTNKKLKTLNVPIEGCYKITRVRGMSVVLASPLDENVKEMHEFIYGSALESDEDSKSQNANITTGQ
ncbi:MAG: LCP family protein [Clostridiaceae bacterium]|nr:LCP family protein [Clostridiaceae bacterium]